jgi:hypothetical protein
MELVGLNSMSLFSKKNLKKTEVCNSYEKITNLLVGMFCFALKINFLKSKINEF